MRASSHHDTKQEAIGRGWEISRNQKSKLCIYNKGGRIARSGQFIVNIR